MCKTSSLNIFDSVAITGITGTSTAPHPAVANSAFLALVPGIAPNRRGLSALLLLLAALTICLLPNAAAAQGFAVRAVADITMSENPSCCHQDTGWLPNASATSASVQGNVAHSTGGTSTGNAFGTAAIGALGGYSSAKTTNTYYLGWVLYATDRADFRDTVTVKSTTLAQGTPVTLVLNISLTGDFLPGGGEHYGLASSNFGVNGTGFQYNRNDLGGTSGTQQLVYNTTVGSTLNIEGWLSVSAQVDQGGYLISDFAHTAHYYIDSQTSDVTLASASGHDYATPNTPAGTNVSVQSGGVTITFANVTAPGNTKVIPIAPSSAGALPAGYSFSANGLAFDIKTTAEYSGPITICFRVPSVTDPAVFANLRVLHGEKVLDSNGNVVIDPTSGQPQIQLVDRTVLPPDSPAPEFSNQTIYTKVDSLSPFVIVQFGNSNQPPVARAKDITVPADGPCSASVAPNDVDAGSFDPDSGDTITLALDPAGPFGLGEHRVILTATDSRGASSSAMATVTVVDQTPPTIVAPLAVSAATGAGATAGTVFISDAALGTASAGDNCSGVAVSRSGVPAGNLFSVGNTTITYIATDGSNNTASATQTVTVIDDTPPVMTVPADITVNATSPAGATVNYVVTAKDNVGVVALNCAPSSGSVFPIGPTVATCTARDAAGNRASGSFQVKVRGAAEQIVDLIQLVRGQALPPALQASLLAALQTALANPQNLPSACHALTIFIAAAQALSGKAIPVAKANLMIADATRIKAVLGCP